MYKLIKNNFKYVLTGILLILGFGLFAQNTQSVVEASSLSIFGNTLFNVLLSVIILLLIIISVLASVLKNVASATKDGYSKHKSIPVIATLIMLSFSKNTFAQQAFVSSSYMGLGTGLFYLLITIIGFEIIIIAVLINSIQLFIRKEEQLSIQTKKKEEPSLIEKLNASVSIEEEEAILMDHEYDGIKELDNNLPPWWKYGFYLTIVWGFIYLVHFHVTSTGDLQGKEYEKSMIAAKIAKEEYQKNAKNNVNENTVTFLTDQNEIEKGKVIFQEMCSACHGMLGEGGVGTNLTDNYWLHGGSAKDIFSSIKYGWPNNGMKSWANDYSPSQMQQLVSYIKTLSGTNPPNAKEKQGELYIETSQSTIVNDSTSNDSLKVQLPLIDSTSVSKK